MNKINNTLHIANWFRLSYTMVEKSRNSFVVVVINDNNHQAVFSLSPCFEIEADPDFSSSDIERAIKMISACQEDFLRCWKLSNNFQNPFPISWEKALEIFAVGTVSEICDTLLQVSLNKNESWQWIQEQCLRLLQHPLPQVRGLAATCLGHVARIHKKLDCDVVIPALKKLLDDEQIALRIEAALDNIQQ